MKMVQFLSYRKITKLAFADENTTFLSGYVCSYKK